MGDTETFLIYTTASSTQVETDICRGVEEGVGEAHLAQAEGSPDRSNERGSQLQPTLDQLEMHLC